RKADYLRHVVDEIVAARPQLGEPEALEVEARRLSHADELGTLTGDLARALDTAGLARAAKLLASLQRVDPETASWQPLLDSAFANVEELSRAVRAYADGIESDPGRLGAIEQRRDTLFRLTQK